MNEIDKKKYMNIINKNNKQNNKENKSHKGYIKNFFIRTFIVLILFTTLAICCKKIYLLQK